MKLVREAGITPNNLPDSEYNGFQLVEALETYLQGLHGTWLTLPISAVITSAGVPYVAPQYRIDTLRRVVEFRGVFVVVSPLSTPQVIATLPGAATPGRTVPLQINTIDSGFVTATNDFMTVNAASQVILPNPMGSSAGNFYSLEGLWFAL
jgi:hypothetical protein